MDSLLLQRFWENYSHTSKNNVLRCNCKFIFNFSEWCNYMSLSHWLSLIAAHRPFNVLLALVASIISFNVMARGIACLVTKLISIEC